MYLLLLAPSCCCLVMFEIELMGYVDYKAADDFSSLSKKEKREASLDQLIAVANAEREVHAQWSDYECVYVISSACRLGMIALDRRCMGRLLASIIGYVVCVYISHSSRPVRHAQLCLTHTLTTRLCVCSKVLV